MKARLQRTHFMGSSNRNPQSYQSIHKTQSVFQRSFNKSRSLYAHDNTNNNSKQLQYTNSAVKQYPNNLQQAQGRTKPFLGTHNQFESRRFDKMNKKQYKHPKMLLAPVQKVLDYSKQLNKQVGDIVSEYKQKNINMHKLRELKRTFIKNNRNRRNLNQYYRKFVNNQGVIDEQGMRKLVKQYGFDVNKDQISLLWKLTKRQNIQNNSQQQNQLSVADFIELMTKQDIYYKTLQLNDKMAFGEKQKHFPDKLHQILRNKFPRLKQAFKIYRQRKEDIDYQKYQYVMKKLDLTDLVIPKCQRLTIFENYSENGIFNVQGLVCDIAQQQYGKKIKIPAAIDFSNNLHVNQEENHKLIQKARNSSLKNMSVLQYENHLKRARDVIVQFKQLLKQSKNSNEKKDAIYNIFNDTNIKREKVSSEIQGVMKKNGINFQKDDYDAFLAYLDFDVRGQISQQRIYKNVFEENQKQAEERFERKMRNQPPKNSLRNQSSMLPYQDEDTALKCIRKIKDHKMNPQNRKLFNQFDKDKDGYISTNQFVDSLKEMNLIQNWQINALVGYFDENNKGSIDYCQFTTKFNKQQTQLPFVRTSNSKSCHEWSNNLSTKRSFIKANNQSSYQNPHYTSAWPQRLKHSDLSLIQPPSNSAMYASEVGRFTQRRQDYGSQHKFTVNTIRQNKIHIMARRNEQIKQRIQKSRAKQEDRQAAKNYSIRLTQETYERNCHK